jgi:fumarylpyruvate hydrolase
MTGDREPWAAERAPRPVVPLADGQGQFPVHRVYCVGQNYSAHAREMGESGREPPFFFAKPADAVCLDPVVPWPPMTQNLHHEVELVAALGGGGRDLAVGEALNCVFGYTVGVDLTRRDLQAVARAAGRPWTTAKGFDHSAPLAPLNPVGRCSHPRDAAIRLAVNGEVRQEASIVDMSWSVAEIIAELSRFFELRPGDLIFTGTPPGVGRLEPGDRVDCEVEGVARLEFVMENPLTDRG